MLKIIFTCNGMRVKTVLSETLIEAIDYIYA